MTLQVGEEQYSSNIGFQRSSLKHNDLSMSHFLYSDICTGDFHLVQNPFLQISIMQFFKTFQKYLPNATFELFISLLQFFGQKIAKLTQ